MPAPAGKALLASGATVAAVARYFICAAVHGISPEEAFARIDILVLDVDDRFKFVKRIAARNTGRGERPEPINGITASGQLYVSTTHRLAAFALATDKTVWQRGSGADCRDRMEVSTDGRTIYVPSFGPPKDAAPGETTASIVESDESHDTIYSPASGRIHPESLRFSTPAVAAARTNAVVRNVVPVSNRIPPFPINGRETRS